MAASGPNVITVGSMSKIAWAVCASAWIRAERSVIRATARRAPLLRVGHRPAGAVHRRGAVGRHAGVDVSRSPQVARRARPRSSAASQGSPGSGCRLRPAASRPGSTLGRRSLTSLSLAAREHGLVLPPGPRFTTGGVLERRLRIPITLPPERTTEAMQRLALAWEDVRGGAHLAHPRAAAHRRHLTGEPPLHDEDPASFRGGVLVVRSGDTSSQRPG